jgi:GT2 family glycosyltransferase
MRDIGVAVTCYNNESEVLLFARQLLKQSIKERIQLFVTCNSCSSYSKFKKELNETIPSAVVFDAGKNLGYLNGCLYGVKRSINTYSWVMVCNTDIEFKEDDFFEKALSDVNEDIWCIGPDVTLVSSGKHQNPFFKERPSNNKILIWRIAYSNYLFFRLYFFLSTIKSKIKSKTKNFDDISKNGNVYSLHGSCFIMSADCMNEVLSTCKNLFMYGEELLVSEIIYKNRKKAYYNDRIGILHNENQVTGQVNIKNKQKWFKHSMKIISNIFKNK